MKPVIGIIPLWDDEKESLWMLPGYMDGIIEAGGIPIMFPMTDNENIIHQLMNQVDGILFTGGQDVSPEIYGEKSINESIVCCQERDSMEKIVLKVAIEQDKSVLGICRGIQFINVALGGTLYQDISMQHPSDIEHKQTPPYNIPKHNVFVYNDTPLSKLLNRKVISVNSYHHQAIKNLSPKLEVMAISEDALVEAVYKKGQKFFWAVQWHPEFSYKTDPLQKQIFVKFIESMS